MDFHFQVKTSEVRKKHKRWPTNTPTNGQKSRSSDIINTVPIKKHGHSIQRVSPFTKIKIRLTWAHLSSMQSRPFKSRPFNVLFLSRSSIWTNFTLNEPSLVVGMNPKKIYGLNVGLNIVQYLGLLVFNVHLWRIKIHEVDPRPWQFLWWFDSLKWTRCLYLWFNMSFWDDYFWKVSNI